MANEDTFVHINLDKFKPLFRELLKLPYEVGLNLFYDAETKKVGFELSKGVDKYITIPYDTIIGIHTHPDSLYKSYYKPPTHTDYVQSIWDSFRTAQNNIVLENEGIWFYRPNIDMIKEVIDLDKDIFYKLEESGSIKEGETLKAFNVKDELADFIDIVDHNTNNTHLNLILSKQLVIDIILKTRIKSKPNEKILKAFREKSMEELMEIFRVNKKKINLEEYIDELYHIVNKDLNIGYNVSYISWDKPLEITLLLNGKTLKVFKDMKDRGHIFDENDADIVYDIAEKTKENSILRK